MANWRISAFTFLALSLSANPGMAQNPIPNPGFESWSSGQPVGWFTTNFGFPPDPVTQTSDQRSGSWAVRGEVIERSPGDTAIPALSTGGISGQLFPTTTRWAALDGFYKLSPQFGDYVHITVVLLNGIYQVGVGNLDISMPTSTYLAFSVPIVYNYHIQPESAWVAINASGALGNLVPHLGTWFQLDDLSMSGSVASVCPVALTGDVNMSGNRNTADIIYLVGYVLKDGVEPTPCIGVGDVNCSGSVTTSDIIYLVNSVLKAGPAPCDVCPLIPFTWGCP